MHAEAYGVLDDREVTQSACRAAMHACRRGVTIGTRGLGRAGPGFDKECGIGCGDVFHEKVRQRKGKYRRRHRMGIPHTKHQKTHALLSKSIPGGQALGH
jgi:hypothetical protein